jgi:hypothetical protein
MWDSALVVSAEKAPPLAGRGGKGHAYKHRYDLDFRGRGRGTRVDSNCNDYFNMPLDTELYIGDKMPIESKPKHNSWVLLKADRPLPPDKEEEHGDGLVYGDDGVGSVGALGGCVGAAAFAGDGDDEEMGGGGGGSSAAPRPKKKSEITCADILDQLQSSATPFTNITIGEAARALIHGGGWTYVSTVRGGPYTYARPGLTSQLIDGEDNGDATALEGLHFFGDLDVLQRFIEANSPFGAGLTGRYTEKANSVEPTVDMVRNKRRKRALKTDE